MDNKILICITSVAGAALLIQIAISEWKILEKAGEKGWKALIPFYNIFMSHHIVGMNHAWFILEMIIWTFETFVAAFLDFPLWFETAFLIFTTVFTLVSAAVHANKMCNCFGKGLAFKLGMFFIPYVFPMMLAFGPAEYKKPRH
ncbi:MAG: hypothetical protein IJH96_01775 [Ruminococcus sp.]|nr:hypothetical protein [Ruminococcus sp.]